jgi:RNA-directed DNA polymerase
MYTEAANRPESEAGYIDALERIVRPLLLNKLPPLITLGHIAYSCDVPYDELYNVVSRRNNPYRVFRIKKRSVGYRYICAPQPYLRIAQRWIHNNILCSDYALRKLTTHTFAYAPGSSHVDNAKAHLGANWLLKLDLTRFFESISERQVYYLFRGLGYRAIVAFCLARICTRVLPAKHDRRLGSRRWSSSSLHKYHAARVAGHLPQGAPTSPMLANLICSEMDTNISSLAASYGLHYTRYADDLTFSGRRLNRDRIDVICKEVSVELSKKGFNCNTRKTKVLASGSRQIVTGLLVDGNRIRTPRAYKNSLEARLYAIKKFGLKEHCNRLNIRNPLGHISRLHGQMMYIISIEPHSRAKWQRIFHDAIPNYNDLREILAK